jgi:hypothetical protein
MRYGRSAFYGGKCLHGLLWGVRGLYNKCLHIRIGNSEDEILKMNQTSIMSSFATVFCFYESYTRPPHGNATATLRPPCTFRIIYRNRSALDFYSTTTTPDELLQKSHFDFRKIHEYLIQSSEMEMYCSYPRPAFVVLTTWETG